MLGFYILRPPYAKSFEFGDLSRGLQPRPMFKSVLKQKQKAIEKRAKPSNTRNEWATFRGPFNDGYVKAVYTKTK